jgi:anti-anti-sigma factor
MSKKPPFDPVDLRPEARAQVLVLRGKLVGMPEFYQLLEDSRDRIKDGYPHVVVDMSGVELINSSGAGILAALCQSARNAGGSVALVNLNDRSRKVLELLRLQDFARFVGTVDEALAG